MRCRERRRAVDNQARIPCIELVLRVARETPVQRRMNDHKHIEAEHCSEPNVRVGVRGEPQEHGEERDVDKDKRTASRLVGHSAENEEEPPLVFVNGVKFVSDEAGERKVKEKGDGPSHGALPKLEHAMTK